LVVLDSAPENGIVLILQEVLDHGIGGEGTTFSFADSGILDGLTVKHAIP
jgi:hypothetical protein